MAIEFLEKKLIKSTNITGDHGGFSLEDPLNFEMCRERFAALFTETTRGFYFKVPQNKGTSVAEFLLKTEKLLKLQVHSGFALTNRRTIIWVQPNDFWRSCPMRRSLLTGLLRAGIVYDVEQDNFEQALLSDETPHSHLARTRKALLRFLCGYTKYTGPNITGSSTLVTQGWRWLFENKDEHDVRSYLKHPDGKRPRINPAKLDLSEVLWA